MPHLHPTSFATIRVHKVFVNTKTNLLTGGDFMNMYRKIKYHYEFSHLPITDDDIQDLYGTMEEIKNYARHFFPDKPLYSLSTLDIFISEETPTMAHGTYDFESICVDIYEFKEKHPNPILEKFLDAVREKLRCPQSRYPRILKEIADWAEKTLEELLHSHSISIYESIEIQKIISKLKDVKFTHNVLGRYNYTKNRIFLYIDNIVDYFIDAPFEDKATKIKTGLEIVLAHEVFHAIHFHSMGSTYDTKLENWSYTPEDEPYQKSVIEGLARWFEYDWCLRRQDDNKINTKITNWYIEELHNELDNFLYPQWPYAAARVIIQFGPTSWFFAKEIIKKTLDSKEDHWKKAYEFLVRYDMPIKQRL